MVGMWKEVVVASFKSLSSHCIELEHGTLRARSKTADHPAVNFGPRKWIQVRLKRQ